VPAYRELPRVTSDCKPFAAGGRLFVCAACGAIQKTADERWFSEIKSIYDAYEIYGVAGGAEQLIFSADGAGAPRSRRLIDALQRYAALPERGRLIDIGCGNGAALCNFAEALPRWELYGSELSNAAGPALRRLPQFRELYTVPPAQIPGRFDLVSMIHSLEHMPAPVAALNDAKHLVSERGTLFVEVPDVETSPFDVLVADHLMHFSTATLGFLAATRCGMRTDLLTNQVLPKELTYIGHPGGAEHVPLPFAADGQRVAERTVRWLRGTIEVASKLVDAAPIFGIFGTSISAMWLFGALSGRAEFFVDEDPARVGKTCAGRRVLAPNEVPIGATVYVPLIPQTAEAVVSRLGKSSARWVPTAPLG
jgi:SAM-dependent methyltransferase